MRRTNLQTVRIHRHRRGYSGRPAIRGRTIRHIGRACRQSRHQFSRIVLESNGETDKYSRLIKALGLDLESLKSATPEQQFISLAGAIRDNVAEQDRAAAVTALLGSRYTELIPLLSQGEQGIRDMITRGKELNPVTKESAAAAELFNDKVDELTRQFNTFKVEAGNKIIPVLAEIAAEMANAARQSGIFAGVLAGLKKCGNTSCKQWIIRAGYSWAVGLSCCA